MRTLVIVLALFSVTSVSLDQEAHAFGKIFRRKKPKPKPTPTPTPRPSPTPGPGSPYLSASCRRVVEGSGRNYETCKASDKRYYDYVLAAREALRDQYMHAACGLVNDPKGYADAMVDWLDRNHGVCAYWDGRMLLVRKADGYNEYYRLFDHYKCSNPVFVTSCVPPEMFPNRDDSRDPYSLDPYCSLPASNLPGSSPRSVGTENPTTPSQWDSIVREALDEVQAEETARPNLLIYEERTGINGWWVKAGKLEVYTQRVAEKVRAKGVCAISWDAQGFSLKSSNSYSEFWAIVTMSIVDSEGNHALWRKFHSHYTPAHF